MENGRFRDGNCKKRGAGEAEPFGQDFELRETGKEIGRLTTTLLRHQNPLIPSQVQAHFGAKQEIATEVDAR